MGQSRRSRFKTAAPAHPGVQETGPPVPGWSVRGLKTSPRKIREAMGRLRLIVSFVLVALVLQHSNALGQRFERDRPGATTGVGFTGRKVVTLTAKSWINPSSISLLISLQGIQLRLDPNNEPIRPVLIPDADDFKLYQRFVAEAKFLNGKVVSAKFLELEVRAGTTFTMEGIIYVKESRISNWRGRESVTFTRKVEGNPAILAMHADEMIRGRSFRPIFNTLSVEIRGDKVIPRGYGSDFPSHKFWLGSNLFREKKQVQPADFFR